MCNCTAYTWEIMIKEKVPRTIISKELIDKERAIAKKPMPKVK